MGPAWTDAHAPAWGAAYPPPGRPPLASASQTRWQLLSNSAAVKQWSQFAGLLTTVCKLAGRLAVPRDKMWCPLQAGRSRVGGGAQARIRMVRSRAGTRRLGPRALARPRAPPWRRTPRWRTRRRPRRMSRSQARPCAPAPSRNLTNTQSMSL